MQREEKSQDKKSNLLKREDRDYFEFIEMCAQYQNIMKMKLHEGMLAAEILCVIHRYRFNFF